MGEPIARLPSSTGRMRSYRRVPPSGKSFLSSGAARKWGDMRGAGLREPIGRVGAADQTTHGGSDRTLARPGKLDVVLSRSAGFKGRSEEHTSELQSLRHLVCRLLLEKKKKKHKIKRIVII